MSLNNDTRFNEHNNYFLTASDSNDSQSERKSSIRRNTSFGQMERPTEANVLVIYTGGTIGMARNSNNGELTIYYSFYNLIFFFAGHSELSVLYIQFGERNFSGILSFVIFY